DARPAAPDRGSIGVRDRGGCRSLIDPDPPRSVPHPLPRSTTSRGLAGSRSWDRSGVRGRRVAAALVLIDAVFAPLASLVAAPAAAVAAVAAERAATGSDVDRPVLDTRVSESSGLAVSPQ